MNRKHDPFLYGLSGILWLGHLSLWIYPSVNPLIASTVGGASAALLGWALNKRAT